MIFDTHCHYNLEPLFSKAASWQTHWQKAQAVNVTSAVVVGTNLKTSQLAVEIAAQETLLFASLGIHPHEYQDAILAGKEITDHAVAQQINELQKLQTPKVLAIGETGLDYFWLPDDLSQRSKIKEAQKLGLVAQINLANDLNVPIILHVRDKEETAYYEVLSLIKAHYHHQKPFILHCVSGPLEYVKQAIALGAYIGVAGNVTYKTAEVIRQLVKAVPPERVLLETDAPYLAPQENRGLNCEPWMIVQTAQFLQDELNLDLANIYQNSVTAFNLKV